VSITRRVVALLIGVLLFGYPGYVIISERLGVRERFPQYAGSAWALIAGLGLLYGAVLTGIVIRVARVLRLRAWEAFTAGVRGAAVLFVVGFFGPFVYGWFTDTEVGNMTPILGVLGLIIGTVVAAGAALIVYAVWGPHVAKEPIGVAN